MCLAFLSAALIIKVIIKIKIMIIRIINIVIHKLGDVVISSILIGSLSLASIQCPPPGRWKICGVK